MSIESTGPLQSPLQDILPYLSEKLSAYMLKKVDVIVIGKIRGEPPMLDMLALGISPSETIAMLRELANHLEGRR